MSWWPPSEWPTRDDPRWVEGPPPMGFVAKTFLKDEQRIWCVAFSDSPDATDIVWWPSITHHMI